MIENHGQGKWIATSREKQKALFLSVNVFSTKVLIGDTIFTSPTGDGTAISTWSSEPREGQPFAAQRLYLHSSDTL